MLLQRLSYIAMLTLLLVACTPISLQPVTSLTPPPPPVMPTATTNYFATLVPFRTPDGADLVGQVYGKGTTAIILSNMGDNNWDPWNNFAETMARQGYLVVSYQFRYAPGSATFTSAMANQTVADLKGAIAYARTQGATEIVLVGASLGGMATAKAAASEQPLAVVIIGAPVDLPEFDFKVETSELQAITAPKLIIASEGDKIVPFAATEQLFELATEPKELHSYPGSAHGVQLFTSKHGGDLRQRLNDFIITHAPVNKN